MTERPDRPDPLDRLDVFDRVGAPDQWDDITGRARGPELAALSAVERPGGRSRWMLAAAAAAVLVIGAGAVIAVNANDDEGEITTATNPPATPTVTTLPALTTAPFEPTSSTVPVTAPATTEPVPTTAAPSDVPALVSSCPGAEITGNDTISGGGGFETFGRLGAEPSLVVTMPQGQDGDLLQTGSIARGVRRIPGGQVLLVQVDEAEPAWQLVAIDDEGSIRWRRCGSSAASELFASAEGDTVHLRESAGAGGSSVWRSFDVVSGADADPGMLGVEPDAFVLDVEGDLVLFESSRDLRIVDLAAGTSTGIGYPDIDGEFTFYAFDRGPAGVPVVVAREEQGGAALAVAVDGVWRTDRDTLLASVGLTVVENAADFGNAELGNGVWARDPLGATVWFHSIVNGIRAEGWSTGVVGDVVLTNECRADDPNAAFLCGDPWHVALDLATGDVLWERPGFVTVGPAGDGLAMIAGNGGWAVTDLRTGVVVQELDDPFLNECCGLDTFVWTGSDGGVVWAIDHDTVRIYYPEVVSLPTVRVSLAE